MMKAVHIPLLCIAVCITILSSRPAWSQEPAASGTPSVIVVPLANVHERPTVRSRLVTQVLLGEEVRVLAKENTHFQITIPDQGDATGWVQQEALPGPRVGDPATDSDRWIVIGAPKTEALILDRYGDHKVPIYAGTRLPVIDTGPRGLTVRFPDRAMAIIDPADTLPVPPPDPAMNGVSAEEVAKTAEHFQGVRYLAGGVTAQGIDMAGLISIAYRVHGIPVSRDIRALDIRERRVRKQDLAAGDILVFARDGLGLYLGEGRFLRTARRSEVRIIGIANRRYAHSLRYGIRVIGAGPEERKIPAQLTAAEILLAQTRIAGLPLGKRIAYWAVRFIGTPYDPDPLGLYVRTRRIVDDEKADCMYHVFRSVELAESATPAEAVAKALDLRFLTKGVLRDGLVVNYDDRFQYGEDMVFSGKWGDNITAALGRTEQIPGSRGRDTVEILPRRTLALRAFQRKLQDGDIVFWVKDPRKRAVGEIVGHLSVIRLQRGVPYVIHASGSKDRPGRRGGGVVKEVRFSDYVRTMPFIGAFITRFDH